MSQSLYLKALRANLIDRVWTAYTRLVDGLERADELLGQVPWDDVLGEFKHPDEINRTIDYLHAVLAIHYGKTPAGPEGAAATKAAQETIAAHRALMTEWETVWGGPGRMNVPIRRTPLPETKLIERAFIVADGDPSVGIQDTEIAVSGFVVEPASYDSVDDCYEHLEALRSNLEAFGRDVADSAVTVTFDFERDAAEKQIEDAAREAEEAESRKGRLMRTVTVPARAEHEGYAATTATLSWICPKCGGLRGEPFDGLVFDGSRRLAVHQWHNPCRHVDQYPDVRAEAAAAEKRESVYVTTIGEIDYNGERLSREQIDEALTVADDPVDAAGLFSNDLAAQALWRRWRRLTKELEKRGVADALHIYGSLDNDMGPWLCLSLEVEPMGPDKPDGWIENAERFAADYGLHAIVMGGKDGERRDLHQSVAHLDETLVGARAELILAGAKERELPYVTAS